MRLSLRTWGLCAWLAVLPAAALAQEEGGFGLDLTEEAEAPPAAPKDAPAQDEPAAGMELGLDLSADAPELRPPLAIAAVANEAPSDPAAVYAAKWFEDRLVETANKSGTFARVVGPESVQQTLGAGAEELRACEEASCLEEAATALEVERLLIAKVARGDGGNKLVVLTFRRGAEAPKVEEVPIAGDRGSHLRAALKPALAAVEGLGTALAQLTVTPNVSEAETRLGSRLLGTGERKDVVPDGVHALRVTAPGYQPHEEEVTLAPDSRKAVTVTLREVPRVAVTAPGNTKPAPASGPAILARPGLYVAAIGVATLAVASAMGVSVAGVRERAVDADGDGVLDITRAEMLGARRNASAANVLFVAGGLAAVGGGAWLVFSGSF